MSPTGCRQPWGGRFIISLQKGSSVSPMSTRRCAGDLDCDGALWGKSLLNHLGGGEGGIDHFSLSLRGPMTAWWKVLGSPVLTPELQQTLIDGLHAEVGSRSIDELAAQRDEVLLGLLELRANSEGGIFGVQQSRPSQLRRVRPSMRSS